MAKSSPSRAAEAYSPNTITTMRGSVILTSNTANVIDSLMSIIGNSPLKLAFITTAAEVEDDADTWLPADTAALKRQTSLEVIPYTLTHKSPTQVQAALGKIDILYVSGGNVFYLLQQMQLSGFKEIALQHVAAGKIYIGQSAGAIVAGPDIQPAFRKDKADKVPDLKSTEGLGLVDFITLPHWGSEQLREVYSNERFARAYTEAHKFMPLTNYQYLQSDGKNHQIIDVRH